jgi:hypothetical protein
VVAAGSADGMGGPDPNNPAAAVDRGGGNCAGVAGFDSNEGIVGMTCRLLVAIGGG